MVIISALPLGINYLVRTRNFPKNLHVLPPDTHRFVCVYQGVRNVSFLEDFAYVLNEWSRKV